MPKVEKPSSTRDGAYVFRPWEDCPQLFSEEEYAADIQFQKQQLDVPITLPPKPAPDPTKMGALYWELLHYQDRLPPELWNRLADVVLWHWGQPLTRDQIRHERWAAVRYFREQGLKREAAYADAAEVLADTPARAGREAMKKDYDAVEKQIGWFLDDIRPRKRG